MSKINRMPWVSRLASAAIAAPSWRTCDHLKPMIVRILRWGFRLWPFMHGRGWILRLSRLLLGSRRPVRFDIGSGCLIEGSLDDWIIVWAFMRGHERDAPFQR